MWTCDHCKAMSRLYKVGQEQAESRPGVTGPQPRQLPRGHPVPTEVPRDQPRLKEVHELRSADFPRLPKPPKPPKRARRPQASDDIADMDF